MKLIKDNFGTFLHCTWECTVVRPFWIKVKVLSRWSGSVIPLTHLLGDRPQTSDASKGEFSVIMFGLITASRIILRLWKASKLKRIDKNENTNCIRKSWQDSVPYLFPEVCCTGPGCCLESKGEASHWHLDKSVHNGPQVQAGVSQGQLLPAYSNGPGGPGISLTS